ncbi:MAG: hypothetical protein JWP88_2374 [Flaviaesturariibacter sp.]|nr:hypothetical protein [Flaviaesturariibacter sp.]
MKVKYLVLGQMFLGFFALAQRNMSPINQTSLQLNAVVTVTNSSDRFQSTVDFLDAAINSISSFNSLIKKETYRTKITSFNNPTSSDMGFNLENEIQTALKPLLAKTKSVNPNKFAAVVSSLVGNAPKTTTGTKQTAIGYTPVFSTLLGLVGTLTVQEKRITREDLDSFINTTSKYFVQYQRLNDANALFDGAIDRVDSRLKDLQFDLKEYLLDMITILHKDLQRSALKNGNNEELFLKYLDGERKRTEAAPPSEECCIYPSDGIKAAKDIAYNLQKIFNDYQKVYAENYGQVRSILTDAKTLGKNINLKQVEASLKDLDQLYADSKAADVLGLRLNTLFERLKVLTLTEQAIAK